MLGESLLNSLFTSSISDLFSRLVTFLFPRPRHFHVFMCALHFSPPLHGWTPHTTLTVCVWLCICLLCLFFFFRSLKFYVSKSLVIDEGQVCGHACAYNKLKHPICPERTSSLRGCALPFLSLSSAEPCKCGCHSWSTCRKRGARFSLIYCCT